VASHADGPIAALTMAIGEKGQANRALADFHSFHRFRSFPPPCGQIILEWFGFCLQGRRDQDYCVI